MRAAGSESNLAFLRCLSSCHATISALVADLQKFDATTIAIKSPSGSALTNVLDRSFADLFVPYTEGTRYIDRECRCLVDCFGEILEPFRNYMVSDDLKRCLTCSLLLSVSQTSRPKRVQPKSISHRYRLTL